ncbi:entericidin A/B family lipoprotein [Ramlibacter sp. 2FC]|nr:entericidin A/B family lipoprotein [Ramlibacter sp. 2FC]
MKKVITLITLTFLLALTGCNTVRGIGQDIGSAGSAIENAAKK